jgi:hypothetical protein
VRGRENTAAARRTVHNLCARRTAITQTEMKTCAARELV